MATKYGQDVLINIPAGDRIGNYVIESVKKGSADVTQEDIRDEDNLLTSRVVYEILPKVSMTMYATTSSNVSSDFITGTVSSVSPLDGWFIDSFSIDYVGGVAKVSVDATDFGLTIVT